MATRLSALVVWALVAASAVFWGLRLWVKPAAVPSTATLVADASGAGGDLSRLLGAPRTSAVAAAPAAASRFQLTGIMATHARPQAGDLAAGVALIAVDGKLARAYRVGDAVDTDWVLQAVDLRSAAIGPANGPSVVRLALPIAAAPSIGALPGALSAAPNPPLVPSPPAMTPAPAPPPSALAPEAPPQGSPLPNTQN